MILELLALNEISPQEESLIFEALELAIDRVLKGRHNIEKFKLISQDCFDTLLLDGLRLRNV